MELHTVPGFNKTEEEGYVFVDDGETAEVRITLPDRDEKGAVLPLPSTSQISVLATENSLKVELSVPHGGAPVSILDCEDLWASVKPAETAWTLDPTAREVTVHLSKCDENEPWRSLTRQGKQNEAAKAFAQLDKVKKLFESTREGTPREFDDLLDDLVSAQREEADDPNKPFPVSEVRDGNRKNALHFAAQLGNLELCKHLVGEHGVPADSRDVEGETPLSLACASAQAEVVAWLLDSANADPNLPSASSSFPIHRSAMSGDLESLKRLVAKGADVNVPSDLGSPLHCAAGSGGESCVKYLLSLGGKVDLEMADSSGVTPLIASVAHGDRRTVNLLLEAGANPNALAQGGATALHIASSMDDEKLVTSLLNKGADPNAKDKDNLKPIHAAAVCECRSALTRLLQVTERIPGVVWTADGMIDDAKQKDGYVKDFSIEEVGGDAAGGNEMRRAEIDLKVVDAEGALDLKQQADGEFRKQDFELAIKTYTRSIDLDNSNSAAYANRCAARIQLKRYEEALEDAMVARTLKPDYMKAYYREGMCQQELGNWEEAAQAYFEGCRLENENAELIKRFQHAMRMAKEDHKARANQ